MIAYDMPEQGIDKCRDCEKPATHGIHGVKDGEVVSHDLCDHHYNVEKRSQDLRCKKDSEEEHE